MRVVIFGATGVLGRHVVPRLVERGHQVRVVVRQPTQATTFQQLGVDARLGDILDAVSVAASVASCDAALHLATAIPKPGGAQDWGLNDRIRREGTQHLLAACQQAGVRRYVQQSTAFLCGDTGTTLADESTPLQPNPFLQSTLDMEALVQASSLEWCILRGGFFYGPNTFEDAWRVTARQGSLQLPGTGDSRLSLIHQVDMATATVLATEKAPPRSLYHVVDDLPVTYRDFLSTLATLVGGPAPTPGGSEFLPSFAASNQRIKDALAWSPVYPTYRSGLV